jgi:hypothetical protein
MKTKVKLFMFILFLIGINLSCSNELSQPPDVATLIEITYQTGPEISPGGYVEAWIENTSNRCISFPIDFDIKVFVEQHEAWIEVPNLVTYVGDRPEVLKPKGDALSDTLVNIRPDISALIMTEPVNSYALITGNLCDDEDYVIEKKIPFVIVP